MDWVSDYSLECAVEGQKYQQSNQQKDPQLTVLKLLKLMSTMKRELRDGSIRFGDQLQQLYEKGYASENLHLSLSSLTLDERKVDISISNSIEFYGIFPLFEQRYEMYVRFTVELDPFRTVFSASLLQNGCIFSIRERMTRTSFNRYLMVQNAALKYGSIHIQPASGEIKFIISNELTKAGVQQLIDNPFKLISAIQYDIGYSKINFGLLFNRILYYTNNFSSKLSQLKMEDITKFHQTETKEISKHIKLCHIQTPFLYDNANNIRFQPLQQQKVSFKNTQFEISIKMIERARKNWVSPLQRIMKIYSGKKIQQQLDQEHIPQLSAEQEIAVKSRLNPKNLKGGISVFSELEVFEIKQEKLIYKSSISQVYVSDIVGRKTEDRAQKRCQFVRKKTCCNKLENQTNILNVLRDKRCLFVARYFKSNQHSDSLFLEYCPMKSIDHYLICEDEFVSFETRMFFMFQVTLGLKFLRDIGIVHVDLKPQNVLVKLVSDFRKKYSTFLLRLIDFGESYSSKIRPEKENRCFSSRGFTIPYAPPELVRLQTHFDQKTDVFSYGVMMLELLFCCNLTDIQRLGSKAYQENIYWRMISMCPQNIRTYGFQPLIEPLYFLALKCVQPRSQDRPCLDWICIIMQECLQLLKKNSQK